MKFTLDWLLSPERKRLRQLKIEEQELKNKILEEELKAKAFGPVFKSIRLIGTTVVVVLNDGMVLGNNSGGKTLYDTVKKCTSEAEVIGLFFPEIEEEKIDISPTIETSEERKIVREEWQVLVNHPDFEVRRDEIYFKGISMPLPAMIVAAFIEIVEKLDSFVGHPYESIFVKEELEQQYTSLKMFTLKMALNPIQSSREDALKFVKMHDIKITSLGNLVMYRRILSIGKKEDKKLTKFVSYEYLKLKKWKKSPANYHVWIEDDGSFTLHKGGKAKQESDGIGHSMGNLKALYDGLGKLGENRYTDAYTRTMDIRIGSVYSLPEEEVDIDSRRDCSAGLHTGSKEFGFSGNGDTMVLCLVNPAKIRSVPYSDTNKMRVSEMFIAAIINDKDMGDEADIVHFDEEYHSHTIEELYQALDGKTFEETFKPVTCQDKVAPINCEDIRNIIDLMSSRIVKV